MVDKLRHQNNTPISGTSSVHNLHPELKALTDRISKLYKTNNGTSVLYWHLVQVIDSHINKDNYKKLKK